MNIILIFEQLTLLSAGKYYHTGLDVYGDGDKTIKLFTNNEKWDDKKHSQLYLDNTVYFKKFTGRLVDNLFAFQ